MRARGGGGWNAVPDHRDASRPRRRAIWGLAHFCGAAAFATEVALTGRFFTAEEAHQAGMIARVCPKGEHVGVAKELARGIANNPPLSVRSTVRSRRYFMDRFEGEIAAQTDPLKLYLTEDFREICAGPSGKARRWPVLWTLMK